MVIKMTKNDLIQNLQKFSDAHGITTDIPAFVEQLPAGEYMVLLSAIESNDSGAIVDILNTYSATQNDSYTKFTENSYMSDELMEYVSNLSLPLIKKYITECTSIRIVDESKYNTSMLKTFMYEDLVSSAKSSLAPTTPTGPVGTNKPTGAPTNTSSANVNPKDALMAKMTQLKDKLTGGKKIDIGNQQSIVGVDDSNQQAPVAIVQDQNGEYHTTELDQAQQNNPSDDLADDPEMAWLDNMIQSFKGA